jgi:peptidoglycan hydrolase FlgJ
MLTRISREIPAANERSDEFLTRLKGACAEFESIFLTYLLKTMRSTGSQEGLIGNSHESRLINEMFDENLAQVASEGGGIGLGRVLFERFRETYETVPSLRDGEPETTGFSHIVG